MTPCRKKYKFLDRGGRFEKPRTRRKIRLRHRLDCASFERLGQAGECIGDRKIFINIDHHESNTRYADVNWVSPREPSTGELIFKLLKVARWPITPPIADQLFTAVSTDTGSFPIFDTRPARSNVGAELVTPAPTWRRFATKFISPIRCRRARAAPSMFTAPFD